MHNEESVLTIDRYGDKYWRNKAGELHRLDGHAIEWKNGDKFWYRNGELHRLDGPAVEWKNGRKEWWQFGELHRIEGPAFEIDGGNKIWYLRDKRFKSKEAFFDALTDEEKKIALFSEAFLNA